MSEPRIRSIDEFVAELRKGPGPKRYLSILDRVDVHSMDLAPFATWAPKHYTRNCIARTDHFELLLICYEPGQRTSIHDYSTEEAWVHLVKGTLMDERFEHTADGKLRKISSSKLVPDSFTYLHNGYSIHRYTNASTERAVTLNLYARPLRTWKVYDERTGSGSTRQVGH